MPAKAKSKPKKAVKQPVRKPAPRKPPTVTEQISISPAKQDLASPDVAPPVVVQPSTEPSVQTPPPQPVTGPQTPEPAAPPSVPTAEPVGNLEQILDNDKTESEASGKNQLVFTVGVVGTLGLIAVSVFIFVVYLGSQKSFQPVTRQTTVTPTASPTPAFSRATITFEVVNASGVAGAAGKGKDALTQYGYSVVAVGNGKKQTKTELFLSKSLSSAAVLAILADASSVFSVASSSGDLVGSTASARIVLGSK